MKYRKFGRIGWDVSEISFGAWAVGGEWGAVDDGQSIAAMKRALEHSHSPHSHSPHSHSPR